MVKIIDCPRDAIQGLKTFIPTEKKIDYFNSLLRVGFDTIDFGSFVSHKSIPQLADTSEVTDGINMEGVKTKLLAIIANLRGAQDACKHENITYLGFPFSISETFQLRNTHRTIKQSFEIIKNINDLCSLNKKELIVHISMAFGNPYQDEYSFSIVNDWVSRIADLGISTLVLSDTVAVGDAIVIEELFDYIINKYKEIEFGAHLHTILQ